MTEQEIPRHVEENPMNYTNTEMATRKKALKDMKRDYPHLPNKWLEMVYDFHEMTPKEEIEEIINSGKWEVPGKFSEIKGGIIKCGEVLDDENKKILI